MTNLAQERMGIAVAGIAAAEHLLEITTEYVKEREAFGRPLAKLQHIRFEIAEMATECAVTRDLPRPLHRRPLRTANSTRCTPRWPSGGPPNCRSASPTAASSSTAATATWPSTAVARAFTDGRIQTIYGGTTEIMKEIIGRSLLG